MEKKRGIVMIEVLATNIISPIGYTIEENYRALQEGRSALSSYDDWQGVPERFAASLFSDEQNKELLPLIYKNLKCDNIKDARLRMLENLSLSKAVLSIYTMQDLLDEGGEYRFNTPSVASGNWQYRLPEDYASCASLLLALTEKGKR